MCREPSLRRLLAAPTSNAGSRRPVSSGPAEAPEPPPPISSFPTGTSAQAVVPVVDASVVVDWVVPGSDPRGPARLLLDRVASASVALVAPRLLLQEVANALLTGVRRGRWDGEQADAAFDLLRRLPVTLVDDGHDLERAWELARRYDEHPIYDMLYVAVADRRSQLFVTADQALRRRLARLSFVVGPEDWPP